MIINHFLIILTIGSRGGFPGFHVVKLLSTEAFNALNETLVSFLLLNVLGSGQDILLRNLPWKIRFLGTTLFFWTRFAHLYFGFTWVSLSLWGLRISSLMLSWSLGRSFKADMVLQTRINGYCHNSKTNARLKCLKRTSKAFKKSPWMVCSVYIEFGNKTSGGKLTLVESQWPRIKPNEIDHSNHTHDTSSYISLQ